MDQSAEHSVMVFGLAVLVSGLVGFGLVFGFHEL